MNTTTYPNSILLGGNHVIDFRRRDVAPSYVCSCGHDFGTDAHEIPQREWVKRVNAHLLAEIRKVEPSAAVFFTLAMAGKTCGAADGIKGRAGGWIYSPAGRPICQGWAAYGARMIHLGHITRVRDLDGRQLGAWIVREYA